jgi:hypothetical protein
MKAQGAWEGYRRLHCRTLISCGTRFRHEMSRGRGQNVSSRVSYRIGSRLGCEQCQCPWLLRLLPRSSEADARQMGPLAEAIRPPLIDDMTVKGAGLMEDVPDVGVEVRAETEPGNVSPRTDGRTNP